jgi:hypothetical protein
LFFAIQMNHLEIVSLLLERGADVNSMNQVRRKKMSDISLFQSFSFPHPPYFSCDFQVGESPFLKGSRDGHVDIIKKGADGPFKSSSQSPTRQRVRSLARNNTKPVTTSRVTRRLVPSNSNQITPIATSAFHDDVSDYLITPQGDDVLVCFSISGLSFFLESLLRKFDFRKVDCAR